jgi:hypothetical protein
MPWQGRYKGAHDLQFGMPIHFTRDTASIGSPLQRIPLDETVTLRNDRGREQTARVLLSGSWRMILGFPDRSAWAFASAETTDPRVLLYIVAEKLS